MLAVMLLRPGAEPPPDAPPPTGLAARTAAVTTVRSVK